jgi:hypothetical protein
MEVSTTGSGKMSMPLKDLEARLAIIFFSSIPFTVDLGIL